ncbi:MAG: DUF624 domain-containing protein [Clostridiales bacterium]|jgi:uncharacterized membrane protein YesL|nr:DUF624 domain-containing protein [Clostridiales bacterium]
MDKFFDSENPLMVFLSRLVDLAILNVLTVCTSMLIVTAGGAMTAMNNVLLHLVRRDETYVTTMFWTSFKKNFRQGIPEGLLVLAAAVITAVDMWALHGYGSKAATLLMIVITIIAMFMAATFVYMFALQSRYENTVRGTLVNAFRLAIGNLPRTVGMIAIWLIWGLILVYLHRAAPAFFMIFGLTLPGYLCAMLYNGVFYNLETEGE